MLRDNCSDNALQSHSSVSDMDGITVIRTGEQGNNASVPWGRGNTAKGILHLLQGIEYIVYTTR